MTTFNLRLIPLLPFLGAALLMLFGRSWKRDTVVLVARWRHRRAPAASSLDAFFTRLPEAAEPAASPTWSGPGSTARRPRKVDLGLPHGRAVGPAAA